MANRRVLLKAIEDVQKGTGAPGVSNAQVSVSRVGPDIVDGVAPSERWSDWWKSQVQSKHRSCQWLSDERSSSSALASAK
jgi:hypothetical protein